MKNLVLVTTAPQKSGLAYFHYLALCDESKGNVAIVDNGCIGHGRTFNGKVSSFFRRHFDIERRRQLSLINLHISDNPADSVVILYGLGSFSMDDLKSLHSRGVSLCLYISDSPFALPPRVWEQIQSVIHLFHIVFAPTRELIPVYHQYGAKRVVRMPFAYCRYTHFRSESQLRKPDGHVYYFGTYGRVVGKWLEQVADLPLVIHGHDWDKSLSKKLRQAAQSPVALDGLMSDAAAGQLVLNFVRTNHGACHSMKTFELPAAGACVISNRTVEQLEFFPEESGVMYFDTISDLKKIIDEIVSKPSEIERRISLRVKWLAGQTYHDRVREMLKEIANRG